VEVGRAIEAVGRWVISRKIAAREVDAEQPYDTGRREDVEREGKKWRSRENKDWQGHEWLS